MKNIDRSNVIYPQEWTTKKELEFISIMGTLDVTKHGAPSYVKQCLQGYIDGGNMRDWVGAEIDGALCIEMAKTRLKELDSKKKEKQ